MKWFRKNKYTCIAILVFIIVAVIGYKVINIFIPNSSSAIYGDRLDGKVAVDASVYKEVKTKITEQEFVKEVNVRENGRTINVTVQVMDSTSMDSAKSLANLVIEPFSESQKGYYDFQIFITKESESENNFPIIGYKQHNSSSFSWTKDREKTQEEG